MNDSRLTPPLLRRRHIAGVALLGLGALLALSPPTVADRGPSHRAPGPAHQTSAAVGPRAGCVPGKLNASALLPGTTLQVSPLPGSLDASPLTQISLLGVASRGLAHVAVRGSRSGVHSGRLRSYTQGDGASFVPTRPFRAGETVSVQGMARASGASRPFGFSFAVARPDPLPYAAPGRQSNGRPGDVQNFYSRPDLHPPTITVTTRSDAVAPGYVLATPYSGPGQDGPMIFDNSGQLVWSQPLPNGTEATDLQVQRYRGRPVLTWWQGYIPPQGFGMGKHMIIDASYRTVASVSAGNGYAADLHDFDIAADGSAYLTVFSPILCDLSAIGGPRAGAVTDAVFQQVDVATGLVRREWHALDHVSLSQSHQSARTANLIWPFDAFHINAVDPRPDGGTLLSFRSTWALYRLDGATDQISSQIGGAQSSVKLGAGTGVAWQHDARELADGTISVFDNGATPAVEHQSRGVILRLDSTGRSLSLVRQFTHPIPLLSGSQGNLQVLPNGDAFLGWGPVPFFSEFNAAGQIIFDARMPAGDQSYRGYRATWSGKPTHGPALVVRHGPSSARTLYASWNGATAVSAWRVLSGPSARRLAAVRDVPRAGFETAIALAGVGGYIQVQALDAGGAVLGSSSAVSG